jgi:predicted aspartyl protease
MMLMVRVKGRYNRVREVNALLDFNCHYSWMLRTDAVHLGYQEADNRPEDYKSLAPRSTPEVLTLRGLELGIMVTLTEVAIGTLKAKNVNAFILAHPTPLQLPVDLILGRTFLEKFKLVFDGKNGFLYLT